MQFPNKSYVCSLAAIAGAAFTLMSPPTFAETSQKSGHTNLQTNNAALKMAYFDTLAKESDSTYKLDKAGCAENRAHDFRACFDKSGVHITGDKSAISMHIQSFGREGSLSSTKAITPEIHGNQVQYHYAGLTEWYKNLSLGLEQGFTIKTAPKGKGQIKLTLQSNIKPEQIGDNAFRLGKLLYKDLLVVDAKGKSLPAQIVAEGGNLSILVNDKNAAYPIIIDPWFQQAKLTPDDGEINDKFGFAVSIFKDRAIIGSPEADISGVSNQGAAYIFIKKEDGWTKEAKITANDGRPDDLFGVSVDLYGDIAIVGAKGAYPNGQLKRGSAYVFERVNGQWAQQAILIGDDSTSFDEFGSSVALYGDTAIVGAESATVSGNFAQGAAYVFIKNGSSWVQQAKLVSSDGASSDRFGKSIDLYKDFAIVGAHLASVGDERLQGTAYIFKRNNGAWEQEAKLIANDGASGDTFGTSVSIFGESALIGAPGHKINTETKEEGKGAAYLFVRNNNEWIQQAKFTAPNSSPGDQFGISVKLFGGEALIGAPQQSIAENTKQGAAYLFARDANGTWSLKSKLTADDATEFDQFGSALDMSGSQMIINAIEADFAVGASYIISRLPYYTVADKTLHLSNLFLQEENGQISNQAWRALLILKSTQPKIVLEVVELEKIDNTEAPNKNSVIYTIADKSLNIPKLYILDSNNNIQGGAWEASLKLTSSNPITLEVTSLSKISE